MGEREREGEGGTSLRVEADDVIDFGELAAVPWPVEGFYPPGSLDTRPLCVDD